MALKYTKVPADTFKKLTLNAGIIVDDFKPADGTIGNILGATTGGINFTATPSFIDLGEDVDNCPKNTKELMRLDQWDVSMSGTMLTVDASMASRLSAIADVDLSDATHVVPRLDVEMDDFKDVWLVSDYGVGGFIAIHLMNAMSTGGFVIQTTDKNKGQFAFTFTAHFSLDEQETVPYEIYIKAGEEETNG